MLLPHATFVRVPHRGRLLQRGVLLLFLLGAGGGCRRDAASILVENAPGLDREFAKALVHDDDSTLVRFVRRAGWPRVYFAQQILIRRDMSSIEAYARSEAPLRPSLIRLLRAIGPAFDMQQYAHDAVARLDGPLAERFDARRRIDGIQRVGADATRSVGERSRLLHELGDGCEPCRIPLLRSLASLGIESGDFEASTRLLGIALEDARVTANRNMECWLSGALGEVLIQLGKRDSALRLLETGLAVARKHQLIDQVARLNLFLGNQYANEGRWGLAGDHLEEVRRLARDPAMEGEDVRYLCESIQVSMRMEWWDQVEQDLRASGTAVRRAQRAGSPWSRQWEAGLIEAEALVAAHGGRDAAADRLFARADRILASVSSRVPQRGRMFARWAQACLEGGRPREAAKRARIGLAYCDSLHIPEHASTHAVVLAKACLETGDLNGCREALAAFERAAREQKHSRLREWIEYEAARVRWSRARGDSAGLLAALRSGLDRLESGVVAMEASPETYTFLQGENDLHEVMHEIVDDPDLSLEIERRWRAATRLVNEDSATGELKGCADLVAAHLGGGVARTAAAVATSSEDVQVVYHVGRRVIRWTSDRTGTRRDVIPVESGELERMVERTIEAMATDPGDADAPVGAPLASSLRKMADLLLPARLRDVSPAIVRWLSVQADGVLAAFPFEALNQAPHGYHPLLEDWSVVFVRDVPTSTGRFSKSPGTIVADPEISPRLRQIHGGFSPLPHGRAEARSMLAADPSARCLVGSGATKRALEEIWTNSQYLFLAAHTTNGISHAAFIPLAADSTSRRLDSEYLEVADVLAADLSRCELVVLSGCATGVPVEQASSGAPSLASAFLDAGAGTVLRTSWPVRDDQAASIMVPFIELWRKRGMSPEIALNEARRRQMSGPRGYRHPFLWAAYGVERQAGDTRRRRASQ